jgi:hypothetical protein
MTTPPRSVGLSDYVALGVVGFGSASWKTEVGACDCSEANVRDVQATPGPSPTRAPSVLTGRSKAIDITSRGLYISAAGEVTLAMGFTFGWVALSVWISGAWVGELRQVTGMVLAWTIVILVACLPEALLDSWRSPTTALRPDVLPANIDRGYAQHLMGASRLWR